MCWQVGARKGEAMMQTVRKRRGNVSIHAMALSLAFFATAAGAQTVAPSPPPADEPVDGPAADSADIIVTGSLIRGSREDAALPVDVIGRDELERQGSPTLVDLLKNLPGSSGILGETNQFDGRSAGSEGSGSVNLRGLGSNRTLVLLNGRRLAINPVGLGGAGIVDTNIIPVAAIGRIEVLKDGAAATYGSDAIAGVVNFITRTDLNGFEFGGDYRLIDGSKGDYSASAVWGMKREGFRALLAAGYQHRSELSTTKRKFAQTSYLENPEGGYTAGGNPGTFLSSAGTLFRDPGCAALGGTPGFSGTTPACYNRYIDYDNFTEKEDRGQVFGSVNVDVAPHTELYLEGMYARTIVPHYKTSPSYIILASPSPEAQQGGLPSFLANRYYVPASNPGLQNFIATNPALAAVSANGVAVLSPAARPLLLGGNPLFGNGGSVGDRRYQAYRISGGVRGELGSNLNYDVGLTYSEERIRYSNYDTLANRFALALRGLGGPNCDKAPGTAGIQGPTGAAAVAGTNGCQYFNPFSSAIQANAITGQVNPNYVAGLANSNEVIDWFFKRRDTSVVSRLFVADAVISGGSGISLPGGEIKFAVGGQYRRDAYKSKYSALNDSQENPCVSSPDFFNDVCSGAQANGPFVFLGAADADDLSSTVYAAFSELQLPVTSKLNFQLAARYEDYGGQVGSTFNPKIAGRFELTEGLALRGSVGSTFRGPPNTQLVNGNAATTISSILGSFRAVDVQGNPGLKPETATTYSGGIVANSGGFRGSIDYYRFDFQDSITAEPVAGIVNALFPNGATGANNCANPAFAGIVSRFTFLGACSAATISRLRTNYVNGSKIRTSGIDLVGEYDIQDVIGGTATLGLNGTYVIEYKVGAQVVEGIPVAAAFEAAGYLNYQTVATPMPKVKLQAFTQYANDTHNLRFTMNYVGRYTDQRTAPFALNSIRDATGALITNTRGKRIGNFVTIDGSYRLQVAEGFALTATVDNIFDKDPPFARLDLSYDPFTADALGRTFKLGVRKSF
jgi:iron complex outermembrane receptor protein